jgi:hypothetical protein
MSASRQAFDDTAKVHAAIVRFGGDGGGTLEFGGGDRKLIPYTAARALCHRLADIGGWPAVAVASLLSFIDLYRGPIPPHPAHLPTDTLGPAGDPSAGPMKLAEWTMATSLVRAGVRAGRRYPRSAACQLTAARTQVGYMEEEGFSDVVLEDFFEFIDEDGEKDWPELVPLLHKWSRHAAGGPAVPFVYPGGGGWVAEEDPAAAAFAGGEPEAEVADARAVIVRKRIDDAYGGDEEGAFLSKTSSVFLNTGSVELIFPDAQPDDQVRWQLWPDATRRIPTARARPWPAGGEDGAQGPAGGDAGGAAGGAGRPGS